jgi:predicted GTPase
MRLKEHGAIKKFDMIESQKAKVHLQNGMSLVIYMSDDYVLGIVSIREAVQDEPNPDYIVYNDWDKVTENAEEEARRLGIPFVKYGRLRHVLDELLSKRG